MKDLNLDQFTGTTLWHRISPLTKAVLTDGTKYVADETDNVGLMQDIGIDCMMRPKIKKALEEGVILVDIDTQGHGLIYKDGNYKKLYSYPLVGYPPLKIELFVSMMDEKTPCIMLKSEY